MHPRRIIVMLALVTLVFFGANASGASADDHGERSPLLQIDRIVSELMESITDPFIVVCLLSEDGDVVGEVALDTPPGAKPPTAAERVEMCKGIPGATNVRPKFLAE